MEEESKTKFSMNVEFSFSFKNAGKMMGNTLHSPFFYAILPMLQKNTYVDAF